MALNISGRMIAILAAGAGTLAWLVLPNQHANSQKPVISAKQAVSTPAAATESSLAPDLTTQQAAEAYEQYAMQVWAKAYAFNATNTALLSKISLDLKLSKLDDYRADAAALLQASKETRAFIEAMRTPVNIAEKDYAPFDTVTEASSEFGGAIVGLSADWATHADVGIYSTKEVASDSNDYKATFGALKTAILNGYSHFGFHATDIEPLSMRPRQRSKP